MTGVAFRAGWVLQWRQYRNSLDWLHGMVTPPLLTASFMMLFQVRGRDDLFANAVVAPSLMVMWLTAVYTTGEMITRERDSNVLELLMATTKDVFVTYCGRAALVTTVTTSSFGL